MTPSSSSNSSVLGTASRGARGRERGPGFKPNKIINKKGCYVNMYTNIYIYRYTCIYLVTSDEVVLHQHVASATSYHHLPDSCKPRRRQHRSDPTGIPHGSPLDCLIMYIPRTKYMMGDRASPAPPWSIPLPGFMEPKAPRPLSHIYVYVYIFTYVHM